MTKRWFPPMVKKIKIPVSRRMVNKPELAVSLGFSSMPPPVWSKNSSTLAASKKRKFFNGDESIERKRSTMTTPPSKI